MSGCLNCLLAGKGSVVVNGSLSGSGSLSIPAGVTSVSLTGAGGIGTQTYNPAVGNPSYPSGLPPYQAAQQYYDWSYVDSTTASVGTLTPGFPLIVASVPHWGPPALQGPIYGGSTYINPSYSVPYVVSTVTYYINIFNDHYVSDIPGIYVPQQGEPAYPSGLPPYQSDYYSNNAGPSTTATLNAVTKYWFGGSGPVQGTTSTQNLSSNGLGQTLTYSIGTGGFLNYSYTI